VVRGGYVGGLGTAAAAFDSNRGATAGAASPFNASGCAALPFKPKLALRLTGKKQTTTGKHPGIKAKVTQTGIGEAGIQKAVVRLPKSLALDPDNAQALCEFEDGTKDDLENHCPKGSIVGRSRATRHCSTTRWLATSTSSKTSGPHPPERPFEPSQ
jgi:hypothetical protein